jgi:hypothetical protein
MELFRRAPRRENKSSADVDFVQAAGTLPMKQNLAPSGAAPSVESAKSGSKADSK